MSQSRTFKESLDRGRLAESLISRWLRRRGNTVIPAYDIEIATGKGPQVFTPTDEFVSPDLLVWKDGTTYWIEAKRKSVFSWHRKTQRWVTGIDLHHYEHYQRVFAHFNCSWEVWLVFLQENAVPSTGDLEYGCPPECPVGLFGERLAELVFAENHRDMRWGKYGMVYWAHSSLRLLAELPEVISG